MLQNNTIWCNSQKYTRVRKTLRQVKIIKYHNHKKVTQNTLLLICITYAYMLSNNCYEFLTSDAGILQSGLKSHFKTPASGTFL